MKTYDAVVLGLGTMGSSAALELTRRKASVIGFDQLKPPHTFGSHSGQTRVFRAGYAESPEYVPLVQRAGQLWDSFSEEFGTKLLTRSGLLTMGLEASEALRGIQLCGDLKLVDLARLSAEEIRYRYPAFQIPDNYIGLFEPAAGWLDVDAAITGMQKRAVELGAELCLNEAVISWKQENGEVIVRTANRVVHANRLIITSGAWTKDLLQDVGIPIRIVRKTFVWFNPLVPSEFAEGVIPIFGFPPNAFYGFPDIRRQGVKVAEHWGGQEIVRPETAEPVGDKDYAPILETVSRFLPGLGKADRLTKASTCLYSLTPDAHFILDAHPEQSGVVFAAGFSGHGFKFAPVIGEVMADLALNGTTQQPIDFLRSNANRASHVSHRSK